MRELQPRSRGAGVELASEPLPRGDAAPRNGNYGNIRSC